MSFPEEYKKLNTAQRAAVDAIDGPLLVVAGPGTGKTQLLSARVAKILQETDTLPQSILCLTFTEAATQNIRDRLASFIGKDAYDVTIGTYHAFGSEIISNYPEFFGSLRLERPIDDLGKREILNHIVAKLSFDNPLKSTQYHLGDLMGTISELKRALLTPKALTKIAHENTRQIELIRPAIQEITSGLKSFPSSYGKAQPLFENLHAALKDPGDLTRQARLELETALEDAQVANKSTPLTKWKNTWLHKNSAGDYEFTDPKLTAKLLALATVLEKYDAQLRDKGLFDFDDMIVRAIEAIENNPELKHNLQERYLYILLDEFQDTNAAQFKLVQLLSDNPVHEGQPNVMAVGDDDQAIYAFQGAESSNMLDFARAYRAVGVVNLTSNYRSHPHILHAAHNIAGQIESRLHKTLDGVDKQLVAAAEHGATNSTIARHDFIGPSEEYAWIASQIQKLIKNGVSQQEIAVLAPKHRYLEALVPFLNDLTIPVTYEKRENILQAPIIVQLRRMVELLAAIEHNDTSKVNELFPQVLSLEMFELPITELWQTNWAFAGSNEDRSWAELATSNKQLARYIWFFHGLAGQLKIRTLESTLDVLIGNEPLILGGVEGELVSPLKNYYFSTQAQKENPLLYYETLSHLSVIREKLRGYQAGEDAQLTIEGFLDFIDLYESAEQPLINTHPVAQAPQAVQLMTAYKAKGLEFQHVFVLSAQDEVWGARARSNLNKLTLPANLRHIRHAGANEDERLRLLFVAITRAKQGLILTSHRTADSGSPTTPLKYLDEREESERVISGVLPEGKQEVRKTEQESVRAKQASIELGWHAPHVLLSPTLKSLLTERLESYQMSPTHLNTFIDMEYGGPQALLLGTVLRFPRAPSADGEFGNAIHQTLQWYQYRVNRQEQPSTDQAIEQFKEFLSRRYLTTGDQELYEQRGERALRIYLANRKDLFQPGDQSEQSFRGEGVFIGQAHLSGLIDRLELDKKAKTVKIVDFKTGQPSKKWHSSTKLLKYRQQLYMYQLLVEGSHSYQGYRVTESRLEFVEPDSDGRAAEPLILNHQPAELKELQELIKTVWKRIKNLDLPDTEHYPATYSGTKQFITDLLH